MCFFIHKNHNIQEEQCKEQNFPILKNNSKQNYLKKKNWLLNLSSTSNFVCLKKNFHRVCQDQKHAKKQKQNKESTQSNFPQRLGREPGLEESRHWFRFNCSRGYNQTQVRSTSLNLDISDKDIYNKVGIKNLRKVKKYISFVSQTIYNTSQGTFFSRPSNMSVEIDLSWASSTITTLKQ